MDHTKIKYVFLLFCSALIISCSDVDNPNNNPIANVPVEKPVIKRNPAPVFNADSCFQFLKKQVDFGPRVPGSAAHQKCVDFIVGSLKRFGLETIVQDGRTKTSDGKVFPVKNIIGSYKPEVQQRILLAAHFDTRPTADRDTKDKDKPIDGASDGASGVAVLLEIARQVMSAKPYIGIDFIFFDMEDYGDKYCLGSEYWAQNMHKQGYVANYGILLDMVGAKNATFPMEGYSLAYGKIVVDKVWGKAEELGYGNLFIYQDVDAIMDDHVNINVKANIPCIDIIHMKQDSFGFGDYHHTHKDNLDIIDINVLKAVGHTVSEVIYKE